MKDIRTISKPARPFRVLPLFVLAMTAIGAVLLLVSPSLSVVPAKAHDPGAVLMGLGTATIDGVLSPGEWDNAGTINLSANVPEGGTTPATLYAMNDGADLFLGVKVIRSQLNSGEFIPGVGGFGLDQIVFEFDTDHDGGGF